MRDALAPVPPITVVALLAACSAHAPDYLEFAADNGRDQVAAHIADRVGECWFASGDRSFSDLAYSPELNSYSGRPRILLVPKEDPTGLPRLVIEVTAGKPATAVKLFGPLLASAAGAGIQRDVGRWAQGSAQC